jgi:ubiquitin carboxyl-terminal hydrolase 10
VGCICRCDSTDGAQAAGEVQALWGYVSLSFSSSQPADQASTHAAIYHHGVSASGGHYTLDVLHPTRFPTATGAQEGWVRIDDELVSDVRPADVFGATERDDARCAYLLFYRRIR